MYFIEFLLILFWMLIVPILIGTLLINQLFKEIETDLLLAVVCGAICMLAVFYILVIPMQFLSIPLHILAICWCIVMIILCGFSLIFNWSRFKRILGDNYQKIKIRSWFTALIIALILSQAFILTWYQHIDNDDAVYVASATTAVNTDSIFQYNPYTGQSLVEYPDRYVLSPFPIFIATLSKLVLIHPTIVAHTILPAFLIPLSYIVIALLGKKLFPDQPSGVYYFLLFMCVLNYFGNVSIYTNSTFLLLRIWQGKAVLANIIIPAILYFSFRAMLGERNYGEWIMVFACSLTACLVSSMGILLAPIMIACMGFVFAIQNRKIKTLLYSIACCLPCIVCGIFSVIR